MNDFDPILAAEEILSENTTVVVAPSQESEPFTVLSEEALPTPKKVKKKKGFLIGLGVYFAVLLVLIGVAMWFLHGHLVTYESSLPSTALNRYIELVKEKNFEAIYEQSGFEETLLNDKDEYLRYLENIYNGNPTEITLRRRASSVEGIEEYALYFDDKRMSILYLSGKEENGHASWQVTTKLVYQPDYTIICSADSEITVNGESISLLGFTPEEIQQDVFSGAKDPSVYPTIYQYTLSGFLNEPQIEAVNLNGEAYELVRDVKKPTVFRLKHPQSEEEKTVMDTTAINAATTYAKFIAKDATRKDFQKLVYKNCAFYDVISKFNNEWFNKHDSYEFKDVQVNNTFQFSDTDYRCDVTFQPVYKQHGKEIYAEPAHYRITFLFVEEQWLVTSLSIVNNDEAPATGSTTSSTTFTSNTTTTTTNQNQ